jgi:hypothetical protein
VLFQITTKPVFTELCQQQVTLRGLPNPDGQGFRWNLRFFHRNPGPRCDQLAGKCQSEGRAGGGKLVPSPGEVVASPGSWADR